jgi:hypothetical protein
MSIDTVNILLVIALLVLAVGLVVISHRMNTELRDEKRQYKHLYESVRDEANEWENRALAYSVELTEYANKLHAAPHSDAPPSHDVQPIDAEQIIANSDDPVWDLVEQCRDLMPLWELKRPEIAKCQPHHRYAEFATFIANLCDKHRNREGVAEAIRLEQVGAPQNA